MIRLTKEIGCIGQLARITAGVVRLKGWALREVAIDGAGKDD